jgi:maltose alpha-D-glucosyltransferase/alpha-amylase
VTEPRVDRDAWDALVADGDGAAVEAVLPTHIARQRWFQGKARVIRNVAVTDVVPMPAPSAALLAMVDVQYVEEPTQSYVLPLALADGDEVRVLAEKHPESIIARVDAQAAIVDASFLPAFRETLLDTVSGRRRSRGDRGEIIGSSTGRLRRMVEARSEDSNRMLGAEQTNTSFVYDQSILIKLYRRLEDGTSLDVEMGRFLVEHGFQHTPTVLGSLDYRSGTRSERTVACAQAYVTNEGDAWDLTLDAVGDFFERAATRSAVPAAMETNTRALLRLAPNQPDEAAHTLVGTYLEEARLLGQRAAEMHVVLASDADDPAFAPEPFTMFYQRSLYQSMRNLSGRVLQVLSTRIDTFPAETVVAARRVLQLEQAILRRFRRVIDHKVGGFRIRCHGDFHLGQVLFTGNDFIITDFEGEPLHPLSERRLKRSPLRDVAGMLRSFHYAAFAALNAQAERAPLRQQDRPAMEQWANAWYAYVSGAFLNGYFTSIHPTSVLPTAPEELWQLLDAFVLEKAVYELGYELNNRPDWVALPLRAILQLVETGENA